jgi:hypothetical protein
MDTWLEHTEFRIGLITALVFSLFLYALIPHVVTGFMFAWSLAVGVAYLCFLAIRQEHWGPIIGDLLVREAGPTGASWFFAFVCMTFVITAYGHTGPLYGTLFSAPAIWLTIIGRHHWLLPWYKNEERRKNADAKLAEEQKQQAKLEAERIALEAEWDAAPPLPTKQEFISQIRTHVPPLVPDLLDRILELQGHMFDDLQIDKLKMPPDAARATYQRLGNACVEGIWQFIHRIPDYLWMKQPDAIFTQEVLLTEEELELPTHALANSFRTRYLYQNFDAAPMRLYDSHDSLLKRHYSDDKAGKRQYEKDFKEADKRNEARQKAMSPIERSVEGTPYYTQVSYLYPKPIRAPFAIDQKTRFAGTWIIAPSGQGKTNLMWHLIDADRKRRGTVVIMDSKGTLLNAYRGYDDVVLIEPQTTNINPFKIGDSDQAHEVIKYIFSIVASAMTEKQQAVFYPVLRLVTKVPNGSIDTFRKILTLGWREMNLEPYLQQCDQATRDFFLLGAKPQFDQPTYGESKNEILWRLQKLLSTQLLQDIFLTSETNISFADLLDSGKTILINNNVSALGAEGAEFFGRFFLALTWMSAVGRTETPDHEKMPVYFYIDEAQTVIANDTKVPTILDECRSQMIAMTFAHQRLNRITSKEVTDALFNCPVRFASVDNDAATIANRFELSADELKLPPHTFACYVRGQTTKAAILKIDFFDMSTFPPAPPKAPRAYHASPPPPTPYLPVEGPLQPAPAKPLDFG